MMVATEIDASMLDCPIIVAIVVTMTKTGYEEEERVMQQLLDERTREIVAFIAARSLPYAAERVLEHFIGRPLNEEEQL